MFTYFRPAQRTEECCEAVIQTQTFLQLLTAPHTPAVCKSDITAKWCCWQWSRGWRMDCRWRLQCRRTSRYELSDSSLIIIYTRPSMCAVDVKYKRAVPWELDVFFYTCIVAQIFNPQQQRAVLIWPLLAQIAVIRHLL